MVRRRPNFKNNDLKGVSHGIKKPKNVGKTKKVFSCKPKSPKTPKRPSRLAINRNPLTTADLKLPTHKLTSPGLSLLAEEENSVTETAKTSNNPKKFFTSRSNEPAIVKLSKNIQLCTKNGKISMNTRKVKITKKNIGLTTTSEVNVPEFEAHVTQKTSGFSLPNPQKTSEKEVFPTRFSELSSPEKKDVLTKSKVDKISFKPSVNSPKAKQNILCTPTKITPNKARSSPRITPNKLRASPRFTPNKFSSSPKVKDNGEALCDIFKDFEEMENDQENCIPNTILTPVKMFKTSAVHSPLRRSPRRHQQPISVKYFPIFDPLKRKTQSSVQTKKQCYNKNFKKFLSLGSNQMIIDAGQKEYGATQCKSCGLVYEMGDPDEKLSHEEFHNTSLKKLTYTGWENRNQVSLVDSDGGNIIQIGPKDTPAAWKKVHKILEVVDEELGYPESSFKVHEKSYAFLYILENQVTGCLIAEDISTAYRVIEEVTNVNSKLLCCSDVPEKAYIGISRIWVLSTQRRKNIAKKLVNAMRRNITMYHEFSVDEIAFSDPTEQGLLFAQNYTKRSDFLVYRK